MADNEAPAAEGRRRRTVVVAAVAAVAVIAGGAYATSAWTGGGDASPGEGGEQPLVLDRAALRPAEPGGDEAAASGPALPAAGPELEPEGELPGAPGPEEVYRFGEGPAEEDAARLAAALGLDGEAGDGGAYWTVRGSDPQAPLLTVQREAPGAWSYGGGLYAEPLEEGASDPESPDAAVRADDAARADGSTSTSHADGPDGPQSGDGASPDHTTGGPEPVEAGAPGEAEALAAVAGVLEELGLEDGESAEVDASEVAGATRTVRATPLLGGLPAFGFETEFSVAGDGRLTAAHGMLAEPAAAEERETVGAREAMDAYNDRAASDAAASVTCATIEPGPAEPQEGPDAEPDAGAAQAREGAGAGDAPAQEGPCGSPGGQAGAPAAATAEFGLAFGSSAEEPLLVPSWLFHVATADGGSWTVTEPAVAYAFASGEDRGREQGEGGGPADGGAEPAGPGRGEEPGAVGPAEPADPGEGTDPAEAAMSVEPYDEEDLTLTVHFWGGVCSTYTATAEEAGDAIEVGIESAGQERDEACIMLAEEQTAEVALESPVGGRTVTDERGQELPVR
ncbi:hypothetical protein [Streptomyces hoynatensis]|uniref:Large membrane protein n=1 Tax=Streptomyces hoynatensis TaxID=1141874 RepID=A0A3A9Z1B6_9ACTN|nr:hypothetical protein [Streptomyces hoynatensis]RKN42252.1 hypothetical protein D7294_12425 [Streptomyces hoynatensis]